MVNSNTNTRTRRTVRYVRTHTLIILINNGFHARDSDNICILNVFNFQVRFLNIRHIEYRVFIQIQSQTDIIEVIIYTSV